MTSALIADGPSAEKYRRWLLRVILDLVATAHDLACDVRMGRDAFPDAKEGGLAIKTVQQLEHLRGNERIGSVIDREWPPAWQPQPAPASDAHSGRPRCCAEADPATARTRWLPTMMASDSGQKLQFHSSSSSAATCTAMVA